MERFWEIYKKRWVKDLLINKNGEIFMEIDKIDEFISLLFVLVFFEMKECDVEVVVIIIGIVSKGILGLFIDIGVNKVVYFF